MDFLSLFGFPHFTLIIIGFFIMGIGVGVTYFKKVKAWFLLHKILNGIGATITIIGIILFPGFRINTLDTILSIVVLLILLMGLSGGLYYLKHKKPELRKYHIWGGRFAILLVIISFIVGAISFLD